MNSFEPGHSNSADIVLKNGFIYTVDSNKSRAEALAIKGKRIIYVGTNDGIKQYIDSKTDVIDLDGKLVLPGFIDSHAHPSMGASLTSMAKLNNLPLLEAYQEVIQKYAADNPDSEAIYGNGWENSFFPSGGPRKEDLDIVIRDRPTSMMSEDGHGIWVNSKALEVCGITRDTISPKGGVIEKDPETGEPTGTFREDAMDLINNVLPPLAMEQMKEGLLAYNDVAVKEGITTVHDGMLIAPGHKGSLLGLGWYRHATETFSKLAEKEELNVRVRGSIHVSPELGVSQISNLLAACAKEKNDLFQIRSAKIFVDGVIEGHTAYLLEPYTHMPGYKGEVLWEPDELNEIFLALDKEHLQIHVHSIGDAATRQTLDAFEVARTTNGFRDARHQITHIQLVSPEDILRFADLDIIGVPQPMWFKKTEYFTILEVPYLGKERAEREYPMKSFIDAGVTLASASDFPVSMPCPPLLGILGGVTRSEPGSTDPDKILGPKERVSLEDMIASYTIHGAYANFLENETGSLEVGKMADVIVLDTNIFKIPPSEINNTKVLFTLLEGREVYRNKSF